MINDNLQELAGVLASKPLYAIQSPAHFAGYASAGRYQRAPHIDLLNEKLLAIANGECRRLLVMMPPRHGKSWLISQYFPTWLIGSDPNRRVILAGYESDFAARWGRLSRDLLEEHGRSLFGVEVNHDSAAANRWDTQGHDGGMNSLGVGGAITGRGAHVFIIDDPVKNAEDAHSSSAREKVWDWYQGVAYTRLEPGGAVVIAMARWHEDDLAGRLLEEGERGGDKWDVVRLPAIAEEDDQLGRYPGEALWPARFDVEALESIRRTVGSSVWSALYQQHPAPVSGNVLRREWFKYWHRPGRRRSPVSIRRAAGDILQVNPVELPASFDELVQSWDMAFKGTSSSDFVVGQVWGLKGADRFLLDQVRDRMDFPSTVKAVCNLSGKWPRATRKLVEDKANGSAVIASLKHEIGGFVEVNPEGGKEARAHAIASQLEGGNVYIPHPDEFSWIPGFIDECITFPAGKNDDQLDAMTQLLNYQRESRKIKMIRMLGWY